MATVLIIDDSRTSRKMLRNLLVKEGHEIVDEAVNGEEGIEKYRKLHPDFVTMDITMPVMDGIEALKIIMEEDTQAKIIMVTAAGQKKKMMEAVKYGAAEFIAKPFDPAQISSIINKVLEN